ncbi:LON peptidase substrate-binding domain-containing protein [Streptomyces sp. TRM 70351]|uniref:LON peptidase substrate-binding domain-containing protein n=1 Tax=Streptomyces sp. TRM 70351 TaxID=3116552 RepID=UPI002E7BDC8F|nr:LON peptidase substrate-binding domain-containing protein [Streptomyces sp. TRM 70351]MEE1930460.1 LON peptidase substrate-binding domain-containing protein [Streptomyces sp. TRM 70351]
MTIARLPLFPLNTVLFPGLVLPLNVFEPRYCALMRDLLEIPEDEPRPFGVVAIRDGHEVAPTAVGLPDDVTAPAQDAAAGFGSDPAASFHTVGCVADASTIREREGAEGYEALATGTSRFRLLSVDASGPYLVGEVEELEEDGGEGAGALAAGVLRAFGAYRKRLAGAQQLTLTTGQELPEEPSVVSYLVAAATVLDTTVKQRLLAAPDTATRLAEELRLLRRETAVIGKLPSLPAVDFTQQPTSPN